MAALLRVTASRLTRRATSGWHGRLTSALEVKGRGLQEHWITDRSHGTKAAAGETITGYSQKGDGVVLHWPVGPQQPETWSKYHYFWLRDNCMCPQCYHPVTNQRLIDTIAVPLDQAPRRLELAKESEVLRVEWEDGHVSEYPAAWLLENSYEGEGLGGVKSDPREDVVLWGKEIADNPPEAEFSSVMSDDRGLLECLKLVKKFGFCFVTGTPTSDGSETTKLLESMFGVLRSTMYGLSWDFTSDTSDQDLISKVATSDTAYTNLGIAAHTDGNYFSEAPGLEVFHCLHFEGSGGHSNLVDGFKIAQEIRTSNPDQFKVLSTVPFVYHYTDKERHLVNSNTSFVLDSRSGEVRRVHFNDADRLPLTSVQIESLKQLGLNGGDVPPMQQLYEAIRVFVQTSRKESLVYKFRLEPGKLLLFNNHRLLHARTAFTGVRRMAGCYVDKEYYDSKLTMLNRKHN